MKSKSLKINIINYFIISGIESFGLTFLLFVLFFGAIQIYSYELYSHILQSYNSSNIVMIVFLTCIFAIFITLFFVLFIKKMNKVTNYINEICENLECVSNGNMEINIPITRKDELGSLAENVNKMAYNLNDLMEKERAWARQKNNLITNLSHDLRTPLTSILGFLKLITDKNYNGENLAHYHTIILNKSIELKKSIDQLFEFSKINNYDYKIEKKVVSLNELIKQVLVSFTPEFEQDNMEYRISEKHKDIKINADSYLLVRAFENIVTNTIKYAKEGKYLDIVIEKNNEQAVVKFINYGEKINEDELKNIFNKYYRIEKNCKKQEGTGLGMAIVKTVLDIHKGNINVYSSDERTEFEFILPDIV